MTTHEKQYKEERTVLDQADQAFKQFQTALFAVQRQFYPLGNGVPTDESIVKFETAKHEYDIAQAEVNRIVEEIRTGKRR